MADVPLPEPDWILEVRQWLQDRDNAHAAAATAAKDAEIAALRAEVAQLRQYLDTAQRRAAALGDEVAGLREALTGLCIRSPGTIKYENALSVARTVLAARKGEA